MSRPSGPDGRRRRRIRRADGLLHPRPVGPQLLRWVVPFLLLCIPLVFTGGGNADAQVTDDTTPTTALTTVTTGSPATPSNAGGTPAVPGNTGDAGITVPAVPEVGGANSATSGGPKVELQLPTGNGGVTSQPLTIILLLTLIAVAPSMLLLMTSFTRIVIVLGLTRNALNLQGSPPNQVLVGLALFLTLFIMGPTLSKANEEALQPYLAGEITQQEAYTKGIEPFRDFMLSHVREQDLELFASLSTDERPANEDDISTATLVPAFVIGELRAAFLIGFVVFIPFLVIDIVVSSALMSMGMVMLPPVAISLPFKLLLFVVVDGWQLTMGTLVNSFRI